MRALLLVALLMCGAAQSRAAQTVSEFLARKYAAWNQQVESTHATEYPQRFAEWRALVAKELLEKDRSIVSQETWYQANVLGKYAPDHLDFLLAELRSDQYVCFILEVSTLMPTPEPKDYPYDMPGRQQYWIQLLEKRNLAGRTPVGADPPAPVPQQNDRRWWWVLVISGSILAGATAILLGRKCRSR